jgi:hypothetical protein
VDEVWETFGTNGGVRETYTGFLWGNLKNRNHLQQIDVSDRIILNWALHK